MDYGKAELTGYKNINENIGYLFFGELVLPIPMGMTLWLGQVTTLRVVGKEDFVTLLLAARGKVPIWQ